MAAVCVFSSSQGTNANSNPPSTSSSYPPLQPQTSNPVEEHEKNESASNLSLSSSTSSIPNIQDTLQRGLPSLLHLSFNQEDQCFAAGTDQWIKIYNCHPFSEMHSFRVRGIHLRGTGVIEMLDKSYRFALIAGGSYPQYPPTKVIILDNHQTYFEKVFRSQVRAVRLTRDRIIVVLTKEIYIYNSSNMELLTQMETIENPKGLCVVSHLPELFLLVCPGLQKGQVRVRHFAPKMTKFISAHDSSIACLALSQDGKLLGTASTKGTLVRVFSTSDGSLLHEVRRGADRADIYSLAFSPTAKWLAVSSDKGTVHVFALNINSGVPRNGNVTAPLSGSSLSIMKRVLPKYFSSEWSVAQFRLPEDIQYIVGFGHGENTIIIIGMDGSFYGCQFNPTTGGEMVQQEFYKFLSPTKTFKLLF